MAIAILVSDDITRAYTDEAKLAQYAAFCTSQGRTVEILTTCNDHHMPIVAADLIGQRHYGHCVTCVEEFDQAMTTSRRNAKNARERAAHRGTVAQTFTRQ